VLYVQLAASYEKPRQFLSIEDNSLDMVLSQVSDSNLRHTLQFGIGLHHAGLNDRDRSLVEELFSNNKIQVCSALIAFSTRRRGTRQPLYSPPLLQGIFRHTKFHASTMAPVVYLCEQLLVSR
jgi:activating signal cointegrator complex subunit 3